MLNTRMPLGIAMNIGAMLPARSEAAFAGDSPDLPVCGDRASISSGARMAAFSSGGISEVHSCPTIRRPGIFGSDQTQEATHSGGASVSVGPDHYGINATVNDSKGYSYGVNFNAIVTGESKDLPGSYDASIEMGGKRFNGKMIPSGDNQVAYAYRDGEQMCYVDVSKDERSGLTTVHFTPPCKASALQDRRMEASIPYVQYR